MKRRTVWIVLLVIIVAAFWSSFEFTINTAWGQDLPTDNVFSCRISTYRELRLFASKEPIKVTITLQHKLSQDLVFPNILHYQDIFSFHIEDKHGKVLSQNPASTENPTLGYKTLAPGRIYDLTMDIAALYDLLEGEEYSIRAKWKVPVGNKIYKGQSKPINIKIIPSADKDIINLIHRATLITKNSMSERRAQLKLVEMGDKVVPTLLEWIELEELNGGPHGGWNSFHDVIGVLSQIGSDDARKIIIESQVGSDKYREALLKRIDIWQSEDRFEKLIKALDEPRLGRKWAIFKLAILGDKCAIPVLEKIAQKDKILDIRETAKDALAHLKDPNVPMRYIYHRRFQEIELTPSSDTYRIGEPIKINCNLIAGEYGSQTLVKFSKPAWHFLPWGFGHPDMNKSQPFIFQMQQKKKRRYDRLLPVKELHENEERLVNSKKEPLDGYIDITKLGEKSNFTLKPDESRFFMVEDINKAFKITEPGEYQVYVSSFGYVVSNTISINIHPME